MSGMPSISRHPSALVAAVAVALIASGCAKSAEAPPAATNSAATTAGASAQTAAGDADLKSLVPTPANTTTEKGPDSIADNGIHRYFQVTGDPSDVMKSFRTALEAKGWDVTAIVSSNGGGGGGATYTGTHGDAYGVFDGGGYQDKTYIDVCTWPTKPADPNCQRGTGR